MKFFAPGLEDVQVGLTNGRMAVITPAGTEIEDSGLQRQAIAQGCRPDGVVDTADMAPPEVTRKTLLVKVLRDMLAGSEAEDFKADGTPNLNRVAIHAGFKPERGEVDAAWAQVQADPDGT